MAFFLSLMKNEAAGESQMKTRFTLKKEERLCSKKQFDKLFAEGNTFLVYPLKVVFTETEFDGSYPAKAAFAVSKKLFKRAVKRNLIKRRMREAYRLNKPVFYSQVKQKKAAVIFIYIGKEIIEYQRIEKSMKTALAKIVTKIQA
ncbi:MAG: ribonuclease P protein component [Bacteroidota bacterium]